MMSASKTTYTQYTCNLKILRPKVTKNIKNLHKKVCEFPPLCRVGSYEIHPLEDTTVYIRDFSKSLVIWGQFHHCSMSSFCSNRSIDLESTKKTDNLTVSLVLLGSVCVKAARWTLMKCTPGFRLNPIQLMTEMPKQLLLALQLTWK